MKRLLLCLIIFALLGSVDAVRVGVFIEFPDGEIYTKCLNVDNETNAYEILESTTLNIEWSYHELWGHGLCKIEDTGCPASNCYCDTSYWGFFIGEAGESSWEYSPVGFDGGEECWNGDYGSYDGHYCADEGDVLGFKYGGYGDEPTFKSIDDVCGKKIIRRRNRELYVTIAPDNPREGESIDITIKDGETLEPIDDATIKVYAGTLGASPKVFESTTDENGSVSFVVDKAGNYKMGVSAYRYPHEHFDLEVSRETTTTTTMVIVTTTTISTTTTTSELKHFLNLSKVTTSTTIGESTTTTVIVRHASKDDGNEITGRAVSVEGGSNDRWSPLLNAGLVLVLLLLIGFVFYTRNQQADHK